ncbi:hypothetical protein [Pseudomonas frederiksbergensis]|uniref:hypothetical protein n=1 Tax=Pseudomonas frederiksbergensis TaxID=104087 RepID=UPI000F47043D|nr:hypothetical protein [Pseudomonas frederiksbergensis]RON42966.1 hypothetical protein BK667_30660 [Pseudomonas frederiksbergensis]
MACLICGSMAIELQLISPSHFVEVDCPACGYYGIPKQMIEQMLKQKQKLHIASTRAYLAMRAENKQSPWITPVDISIHQLFVISPFDIG